LRQVRGDPEGAGELHRRAVAQLARAGQHQLAGDALEYFARLSILLGDVPAALSYARRQKLDGEQYRALVWLEAAQGDVAAAGRSLEQYAATHPWVSRQALERMRATAAMWAALVRNDGQAVTTAGAGIPDLRLSQLTFARGRAHLLLKDYGAAERQLRATLLTERNIDSENLSPLVAMLCRFYLGQVYEATGKRSGRQRIPGVCFPLRRLEDAPAAGGRSPRRAEATVVAPPGRLFHHQDPTQLSPQPRTKPQ
jgi:tetratricopeptide (TPR) repeat protein